MGWQQQRVRRKNRKRNAKKQKQKHKIGKGKGHQTAQDKLNIIVIVSRWSKGLWIVCIFHLLHYGQLPGLMAIFCLIYIVNSMIFHV